MILAAGKITEIQRLTPPHFIIQHRKLDAVRQPDTHHRHLHRLGSSRHFRCRTPDAQPQFEGPLGHVFTCDLPPRASELELGPVYSIARGRSNSIERLPASMPSINSFLAKSLS